MVWASPLAGAAANAVHAVWFLINRNVQLTGLLAGFASRAFFLVHLVAVKCNGIEQPVDRAERTEIAAKRTVDQDGEKDQQNEQEVFPGKQPPNCRL